MNKKRKILGLVIAVAIVIGLLIWYLTRHKVAVLDPAGTIAAKERALITFAIILSAVVVIPVYALTISIAWNYRASNPKQKHYRPDWSHSRVLESIWWGIPLTIITILSVITWDSSHALDPYRTISSRTKPLTVQVIALDWKWLFIYPDQHIASVNQFELPVNTPLNIYLTSDTVMNSFWVPQLGSQIYAMPGMQSNLHLMATKLGDYYGSSANISGSGFAGMNFMARSVSQADFNSWVNQAIKSKTSLDLNAYNDVARPSSYNPVAYYSNVHNGLFDLVIMKYMEPGTGGNL